MIGGKIFGFRKQKTFSDLVYDFYNGSELHPALTERFVAMPSEMIKSLYSVRNHEMLKEHHRHAIRSPYIVDFKEFLVKVLAS